MKFGVIFPTSDWIISVSIENSVNEVPDDLCECRCRICILIRMHVEDPQAIDLVANSGISGQLTKLLGVKTIGIAVIPVVAIRRSNCRKVEGNQIGISEMRLGQSWVTVLFAQSADVKVKLIKQIDFSARNKGSLNSDGRKVEQVAWALHQQLADESFCMNFVFWLSDIQF